MPIGSAPGYQASDAGDIMSPAGRILRQQWTDGRLRVRVRGKKRTVWVLILEAFYGKPINGGYRPWHVNGDLRDNRLENLVYTGAPRTESAPPRVDHCRMGHELTQENTEIWGSGNRICIQCRDARSVG